MISGAAKDDCGAIAIAAAGITDATDFVKKERRSDSPPLTENAAVDVHKSKAVTVLKDFMVVTLTLAADYERTLSKKLTWSKSKVLIFADEFH